MSAIRPRSLNRVPPAAVTALGLYAAAALTVASLFRLPGAGQDFPHGFAGLAVVMALPVCLLRRRPLPVFGLLLAESFAFALAEHGHDDIALLQFLAADVALCFVAATHARRISVGASLTALAVLGAATVTPVLVDHSSFDATSTSTLALTVVIAWTVGNSLRQRREYAEVLRAQAATQAITAERLRIARELHDVIAHSIGIIAIQAGAGCRVIDTQPLEARNALAAIETTSRETLAGLRRLLGALRQPECGPIQRAPAPGLADLDQLAATTADAGIQVDVAWQGHRRPLPADIDLSAYRIIQEAVTNVVRHAGINHCRVSIDYWAHELAIEVVDDGRGGASDGNGYGIAGMRERVGLLDGQFSAGPRPEGGFRVAARLPA